MRSNLDFKMRLYRIDQMLCEQEFVAFEEFERALKCSAPTLKRDLRHMREVLHAPIVYSHEKNGYYYDKSLCAKGKEKGDPVELPAAWYSPTEVNVVLTALSLFERIEEEKDGLLCGEMTAMKARLLSLWNDGKNDVREMQKRISVILPEQKSYRNPFFEVIGSALVNRQRLEITYYTRSKRSQSVREVSPLRMVNYRGRWYLDAWCHSADDLRTFCLDNIQHALTLSQKAKNVPMKHVREELDSGYGIFSGGLKKTAIIRIDEEMTAYVKDETWHKDQKFEIKEDGSSVLSVPYKNETELLSRVFSLGAHAEIVSPAGLRKSMATAVASMAKTYAKGAK